MSPWPDSAGASANDGRAMWALHVSARSALVAAAKVLAGARIPFLAVKGIVTAYTLYLDPGERPLGDVDIRIRPRDIEPAARAFQAAGWLVSDWKPAYGAFVAELGSVCVDVESVIGAPGLCALSVEEMLSVAAPGAADPEVRVPELHDHAVLLCVNVFKDKLVVAAPWAIEDVRRIAEVAAFDEDRFLARARHARIECIAWIVADWMAREHGSAVWARVKEKLGGERAPRPLYAWAFRALQDKAPESLPARLLARLGADDVGMRLQALRGALGFVISKARRPR